MDTNNEIYVPTDEEIEEAAYYETLVYATRDLIPRAEGTVEHATMHQIVSRRIVECVIGGGQFIAVIWDARTQGTHGTPCKELIIQRYASVGKILDARYESNLSGCLTTEELVNANAAAQEFGEWLEGSKSVSVQSAIRKFREIGYRHQSVNHTIDFIWTLAIARSFLKLMEKEGKR